MCVCTICPRVRVLIKLRVYKILEGPLSSSIGTIEFRRESRGSHELNVSVIYYYLNMGPLQELEGGWGQEKQNCSSHSSPLDRYWSSCWHILETREVLVNVIMYLIIPECSSITTFLNTTEQLVEKDEIVWFKVLCVVINRVHI